MSTQLFTGTFTVYASPTVYNRAFPLLLELILLQPCEVGQTMITVPTSQLI